MEYFFIGERELALAFSLVGVPGKVVVNKNEAAAIFSQITGKQSLNASVPQELERPKVLIITEEVAIFLGEELTQWQMRGEYPLVVEIPGLQGHMEGKQTLTDAIREAIGIQV